MLISKQAGVLESFISHNHRLAARSTASLAAKVPQKLMSPQKSVCKSNPCHTPSSSFSPPPRKELMWQPAFVSSEGALIIKQPLCNLGLLLLIYVLYIISGSRSFLKVSLSFLGRNLPSAVQIFNCSSPSLLIAAKVGWVFNFSSSHKTAAKH